MSSWERGSLSSGSETYFMKHDLMKPPRGVTETAGLRTTIALFHLGWSQTNPNTHHTKYTHHMKHTHTHKPYQMKFDLHDTNSNSKLENLARIHSNKNH